MADREYDCASWDDHVRHAGVDCYGGADRVRRHDTEADGPSPAHNPAGALYSGYSRNPIEKLSSET